MKYSIITPVYNRADCVARCLDSVIRNLQWGVELEHIVVDDGSHDETPKIVQNYADKHPHSKFIPFSQNRGTNAARNAAIAAATGEYCIILDSDDYFVDEAINFINSIASNQKYMHYCFAADDMVEYYQSCSLLMGKQKAELTFENFLFEEVTGDFVHCIKTETLQKYPFDEDLRIYEGVFFKRFYREAQKILYTNRIVTIRERNRTDSVTRNVLRNDRKQIAKGLLSKQLLVEWYGEELSQKPKGVSILRNAYKVMLDCNLLIGNYKDAMVCKQKLVSIGGKVPTHLRFVYTFNLGGLYFYAGCIYVYVRYYLLRSNIK